MLLSAVSALTQTYSKNGDAFSSATGNYATSSHCITGDNCTWISGSQVILGVYAGGYTGGSATWNFNVTQPLDQITSAEVKISWPSVYGKGLHSVGTNTTSTVKVGSTTIASPLTSTAISCGTGDQYAFECFNAVPTYSVPVSAISSSTNITISVPSSTLWDVGTIQLVINYSEPIACSTNSQCGANDWVSGTNTCTSNDVYQNFKTFTCNNAGTSSSYCSNSIALQLKTDCGDTTYGSWGANYCNASGNVEKIREVYNKGCASGACTSSTTQETQTVQTCTNGCTNGTCDGAAVTCLSNTDCGIDGTIGMYPYYCSDNDKYAMYRTHICSNPGTTNSSCSYTDGPKLLQDCGETHTDPWETTCNAGIFIQRSQKTYNQGCIQEGGTAYCQYYTDDNVLPLILCENGCTNGACLNSACWLDSQCGTSGWVADTTQCYLNDVYQNYTTASCSNPGYTNASCSNNIELKLKEACPNGCSNGTCTSNSTGIKIVNGKIKIDGMEFLIKGLDYAPWLMETGPSPFDWQDAFPQTRNEDVTSKVSNNGVISVKDYSGDGKIQAWEVIKFDVETMKKLGANTIRTYAVAQWHDQDLDGVVDNDSTNLNLRELKQGDLPNWAVDELLAEANANNMKVIMGYWVQEENFAEDPFVTDWTDLPVAEQAFGLAVNKYKDNPAVLAWGIGNEVNGAFNHTWFTWGVSPNDFLNALFAYVRTLDTKHPIIYAKYVSEDASFDNLTADIISVNCYIYDVATMQARGEFSIPAPAGKAYMLGEFGHIRSQSQEHWDLAKTMAGGAYLEYNNCWWKGDGQNLLGIVDEYRAINPEAYNIVYNLFGGAPACSFNAECGSVTYGTNTCSDNSVIRTVNTPTCNNAGTSSASCSIVQTTETVQTCPNTCSNGSCVTACSTDAQCGINDWIYATNSCSNNDVYMNFITYKCNNPGTTSSTCSNSTAFKLKQDCGDTTTSAWSANYCNGNNIEKSRTTYNKGCETGACTFSTTTETQLVQTCANNCLNGNCISSCSRSSQCGATTIVNTICKGNKLYNVKRYFTCNNAGKTNSYCSSNDKELFSKTCTYGCLEGACLPKPACSKNSNCGRDVTSKNFCENGNVVKTGTVYTCLNPSTQEAVCDKQVGTTIVQACTNGCSAGKCLPAPCGFSDGIDVSAKTAGFTAWDISQVSAIVSYKVGTRTKTVTLTKNGNDIYSGEGAYATSSSCGAVCNWLTGNQVIVGAYNSDPLLWGGKVNWKFDLGTIDPTKITKVVVKVYRPSAYGKGLHSPYKTGSGVLELENMNLATLTTKKTKCGTDWFAHSCSSKYFSYTKAINSKTCLVP